MEPRRAIRIPASHKSEFRQLMGSLGISRLTPRPAFARQRLKRRNIG
jgi:hypothetical protein